MSATQQVDAERSLVISTFEDQESVDTTSRTLVNNNKCRAVTYFVRRVLECYVLKTTVHSIQWKSRGDDRQGNRWSSIDDANGLKDAELKLFRHHIGMLPRVGSALQAPMMLTIPTDGAIYEPELAHCSSCEPARELEIQLELEKCKNEARKGCLEAELLALELERRRALLKQGSLDPFENIEFSQIVESE